ncbi:hypothetical protein J27TS8_03910 [Robertmurraya siralis]|uniref:Uncharacterized protein n=1 Tax=Robertmurraya siralis TaxID=77777 RepID=A0A919WEM8_9BACI|nr:hypothetical protein [Robertmurraya siralis]GIN60398.1 hypothetical protein J27TS8_03910 [Robertmurraya siralis]
MSNNGEKAIAMITQLFQDVGDIEFVHHKEFIRTVDAELEEKLSA